MSVQTRSNLRAREDPGWHTWPCRWPEEPLPRRQLVGGKWREKQAERPGILPVFPPLGRHSEVGAMGARAGLCAPAPTCLGEGQPAPDWGPHRLRVEPSSASQKQPPEQAGLNQRGLPQGAQRRCPNKIRKAMKAKKQEERKVGASTQPWEPLSRDSSWMCVCVC